MIRFNHKTGQWSDELPSRLCDWLAGPAVIGRPPSGGSLSFTFDSRLDSENASSATASCTIATGIPLSTLMIVMAAGGTPAINSVSDSRGPNTYTKRSGVSGSNTGVAIFSAPVTTALLAGDTVTVTWASSTNGHAIVIGYVSNASASPFDQEGNATPTSTTPSVSTAGATSQATEIAIAAYSKNTRNAITEDSNYTTISEPVYGTVRMLHTAYRLLSATGVQTYQPTQDSTQAVMSLVTFKN